MKTQLLEAIKNKTANVVVLGLGYVGLPVACLFAEAGFPVVGIRRNQDKVDMINRGECPIEGEEPGLAELVQRVVATDRFQATVSIGIAGIRGTYRAAIEIEDKKVPESMRLVGRAHGPLGFGDGVGQVTLSDDGTGGTRLAYSYRANVGGKVAAVGQRMLGSVTSILIGQFFKGLERRLSGAPPSGPARWWTRLVGGGDKS